MKTRDERPESELIQGWAPVYPHLRYEDPKEAIAWLSRVFGFVERVRMVRPDGSVITAKMETPGGGLVMVAGVSEDFKTWVRERVANVRESSEKAWPNLTHVTTVMVSDVNAHHERAKTQGATILMEPTDQPWGLRCYATFDLDGHQWEFSQLLQLVEPETWNATRVS